jgi:tRNA-specific 2-thiouridylase
MNESIDETVVIGLSGGVDSSVAAWLMVQDGARLIGATHYIQDKSPCCNEETIHRARVICRDLGIPYRLLDLRPRFQEAVVDSFVEIYSAGETPNPCISCNEKLRFDTFYQEARELLVGEGALGGHDRLLIATGHYARVDKEDGRYYLKKGKDPLKDQSYMLYRIPRDVLPNVRFPLGNYTKREVVAIAEREYLPTRSIKESQDICFADGNYIEFLRRRLGAERVDRPGPILDPSGRLLGSHRGYLHYTTGQRQGLGLADGPWYVASIDAAENAIIVARSGAFGQSRFEVTGAIWDPPDPPPRNCMVKIRYNSREIPCMVTGDPSDGRLSVELEDKEAVTPGQSAVFYHDDRVIGGGIIES